MALLMLFAALWGVLQLTVLASWSRTVRFSTLVLVAGFGAYGCGVVAVVLQLLWTRLTAALTHASVSTVVDTAGYTADPVIEEVVKVLPLALLAWFLTRVSRQLGLVDHLLLGAAIGAGFGLFESLLRYGTLKSSSVSSPGGYVVQASLGGIVVVPDIGTTLTSWLPEPAQVSALFASSSANVTHLVWSALAGVGVGWYARRRDPQRYLGFLPLAYVSLDHVHYNYDAASKPVAAAFRWLDTSLTWLHDRLGLLLVVVLVAAVAVDRLALTRARRRHTQVLLATERPDGTTPVPLLRFARVAPPLTPVVAARFVLTRRAALYATGLDPADLALVDAVSGIRDQIDRTADPARWARPLASLRAGASRAVRSLRSWRVAAWAVLLLPPVAYLVVGGFPFTKDVQTLVRTTAGSWVVLAVSVAGLAYLAVLLRVLLRGRRAALGAPVGEVVGRYLVRTGSGAGGLVTGIVLVAVGLLGRRGLDRGLVTGAHALDALGSMLIVLGLVLFLWGLFTFPPLALAVTSLGTLEIVSTLTGAFVVTAAGAGALGAAGVYLTEAAEEPGGSSGGSAGSAGSGGASGSAGSDAAAARARRLDELARDPAHGGRVDAGTRAEAEAGLGLEEQGAIRGPITRSTRPGEEFVDADGQAWDVKAFRSDVPGSRGRFQEDEAVAKIRREVSLDENVILDTRGLDASDLAALRAAVQGARDLIGKVLFWP